MSGAYLFLLGMIITMNTAQKYMDGRTQMTAAERQQNRDEARERVRNRAGTPESQKVMRPKWQSAASQQDNTGQRISRAFAQAMLQIFQKGARFMDQEHIGSRFTLLDEAIRTGYMHDDLQSIYDWTVRDRPDVNPHDYSTEGAV